MSMNVGNYVTAVLAGRRLTESTFATFVSLTSLASVITTIGGLAQPVISAHMAASSKTSESSEAKTISLVAERVASLCLCVAATWIALIPAVMNLYHFDDLLILLILGLFLIASTLLPAVVGLSQGLFRYRSFAIAFVIGGVSRPLFFLVATSISSSIEGALSALIASFTLALIIMVLGLPGRRELLSGLLRPRLFRLSKRLSYSALCLTAAAVLTYGDVITARAQLTEFEAADFASAALLTNITVYASIVLISVLIPFVAQAPDFEEQPAVLARWSLALMMLVGLAYTILLFFFGGRLLTLTFGRPFDVSGMFLATYNLVFIGVGIVGLIINFDIARGGPSRQLTTSSVVMVLIYAASLAWFGTSMKALVMCDLLGVFILLVLSLRTRESMLRVALGPKRSVNLTV
jgi:O-antigen/teichoic acid export membrane protein